MAYKYVGIVVVKINGFQLFAWGVLVLGVFGISAQTPEIQSGSYLHKHLKQVVEYKEAQDVLAQQPQLHEAFMQTTAWMFERTKPRVAERNEARALAKMVAASQEFSKLEKKQIQSVLRHTAASTWKTGHTIGVSAAALATVAALVAAWTFGKRGFGIETGNSFKTPRSTLSNTSAPLAQTAGNPALEAGARSRSAAPTKALLQSNPSTPLAGAGMGGVIGALAHTRHTALGVSTNMSGVDTDIATCHEAFIRGNGEIPKELQKRVGVCEMQGRRRDGMEDAVIVKMSQDKRFCVLAVCDGHSGAQAALYAQAHLFKHLEQSLLDDNAISNGRIQRSIITFDETLRGLSGIDNSGTTLAAALFLPDGTLRLINLGDSRVIGVDRDGKSVFATTDHKPHASEELQRIHHAGGMVSTETMEFGGASEVRLLGAASGLGVARALGDFDYKRGTDQGILDDGTFATNYIVSNVATITTISSQQLATARYVVLACDGLWDVMDNAQVAKYVVRLPTQNTPDEIASALTRKAYWEKLPGGADNRDNISVVVLDLGPVSDRLSFTLRK